MEEEDFFESLEEPLLESDFELPESDDPEELEESDDFDEPESELDEPDSFPDGAGLVDDFLFEESFL